MTEDFFEGFFAALRLHEQEFVETRSNVHHERFRAVAARLERARAEKAAGAQEMPRRLRPTMATGLYSELDDALLRLQQGFGGSSPNPSYPGLKLDLTEQEAQDVLMDFSPDARTLLSHLADVFVEAQPTATATVSEPV